MPEIKSYHDMSVELIRATEDPMSIVSLALDLTMKSGTECFDKADPKIIRYLVDAEHHSPLEHVGYTFLIQGVSRSFLAQITRQRTFKPTSGSQHYQDYSEYPLIMHENMQSIPDIEDMVSPPLDIYKDMLAVGIPKEEARQVLPNACAVNLMVTCDARNLMYFLKQRCCNRNVAEMRIFADKVLSLVTAHFPELFDFVGPQCYMDDKCKQGKMRCAEKKWIPLT